MLRRSIFNPLSQVLKRPAMPSVAVTRPAFVATTQTRHSTPGTPLRQFSAFSSKHEAALTYRSQLFFIKDRLTADLKTLFPESPQRQQYYLQLAEDRKGDDRLVLYGYILRSIAITEFGKYSPTHNHVKAVQAAQKAATYDPKQGALALAELANRLIGDNSCRREYEEAQSLINQAHALIPEDPDISREAKPSKSMNLDGLLGELVELTRLPADSVQRQERIAIIQKSTAFDFLCSQGDHLDREILLPLYNAILNVHSYELFGTMLKYDAFIQTLRASLASHKAEEHLFFILLYARSPQNEKLALNLCSFLLEDWSLNPFFDRLGLYDQLWKIINRHNYNKSKPEKLPFEWLDTIFRVTGRMDLQTPKISESNPFLPDTDFSEYNIGGIYKTKQSKDAMLPIEPLRIGHCRPWILRD